MIRRAVAVAVAVLLAATLWACGNGAGGNGGAGPTLIASTQSSCGGLSASDLGFDLARAEYCEAEHLFWSYDPGARLLELEWTRLVVQCGADLGLAPLIDDTTLSVSWSDRSTERADCLCIFDVTATLSGVPAQSYVVEAGGAVLGTIDLAGGSAGLLVVGGAALGAETYPECL